MSVVCDAVKKLPNNRVISGGRGSEMSNHNKSAAGPVRGLLTVDVKT